LKFFVDEEGESTSLEYFVFIIRLIQSQSQARACSTSGCEVHSDRRWLLVLEIAVELLTGSFSQFKH